MANLCNDGTKDFFEAMENYRLVEHLNPIHLRHYSETCSKDHLCKMTNAESA